MFGNGTMLGAGFSSPINRPTKKPISINRMQSKIKKSKKVTPKNGRSSLASQAKSVSVQTKPSVGVVSQRRPAVVQKKR